MVDLNHEQFQDLIVRVRNGDENAAFELVKAYEPEIRRDVRLRLTDRKLRRTLDSTDICQSVFGNFFVRAAVGQFNFDRPEQLLRLLSTMARNKVIDRHRREKSRRPADDGKMENLNGSNVNEPSDPGSSPSQVVQGKELLQQIESRLSKDEKKIAQLRRRGCSWNEIADQIGGSVDALRKRLARACDRVFQELGLDEEP